MANYGFALAGLTPLEEVIALPPGATKANGAGLGSCHGGNGLDADYIWRDLIVYRLGAKPQDMTWWPVQNFGIKWTSKAA